MWKILFLFKSLMTYKMLYFFFICVLITTEFLSFSYFLFLLIQVRKKPQCDYLMLNEQKNTFFLQFPVFEN